MFPTNLTLELDARREDMLREAKKIRLAQEAQQANKASRSAWQPLLRLFAALLLLRPF